MATDKDVLKELSQLVDLALPQRVSHYFYFPSEADSTLIAEQLSERGFEIESRLGADGANWLILATHSVILNEENIQRLRLELDELMNGCPGEYDGWEVALTQ